MCRPAGLSAYQVVRAAAGIRGAEDVGAVTRIGMLAVTWRESCTPAADAGGCQRVDADDASWRDEESRMAPFGPYAATVTSTWRFDVFTSSRPPGAAGTSQVGEGAEALLMPASEMA